MTATLAAYSVASPPMPKPAGRSTSSVAKQSAGRWCIATTSPSSTRSSSNARRRLSYLGIADEGIPVGRIARSFSDQTRIVSTEDIAHELGEWARGYGCDQRLSGAKARRELGWTPTRHPLNPAREITTV